MCLKIKEGVSLKFTQPQLALADIIINEIFSEKFRKDCVVTAGDDGKHMQGSKHYTGLAHDYRTKELTSEQVDVLAWEARDRLGEQYDVVYEYDKEQKVGHLHVEFDPK